MPLVALPTRPEEMGLIPRHGRDGRPKIFDPETGKGEWYTRVTTYVDALSDKSALGQWRVRQVLLGLLEAPQILPACEALLKDPDTPQGRRVLDSTAEEALEAAGAAHRAEMGTALHEATEAMDRGGSVGWVPEEWAADLAAYQAATADLDMLGIEEFGVLDDLRAAGTADRVVRVRGFLARRLGWQDGALVVADLKTGQVDRDRGKIAMQLACYASMKRYNPVTYERSPLEHGGDTPDPTKGLIIHLPLGQGRCHIIPVDLAVGLSGLRLAADVREWRKYWARASNLAEPVLSVPSGT